MLGFVLVLIFGGIFYLLKRAKTEKHKPENREYAVNLLSDEDYRKVAVLAKGGVLDEREKEYLIEKISIQMNYNNEQLTLDQAIEKIQILNSQVFLNT